MIADREQLKYKQFRDRTVSNYQPLFISRLVSRLESTNLSQLELGRR